MAGQVNPVARIEPIRLPVVITAGNLMRKPAPTGLKYPDPKTLKPTVPPGPRPHPAPAPKTRESELRVPSAGLGEPPRHP
jgi:hypothetical protein